MSQYKTLKQIDGQDYITVAEHEEILTKVADVLKAINDAKAAVSSLGKATAGLASSVGTGGKIGSFGENRRKADSL